MILGLSLAIAASARQDVPATQPVMRIPIEEEVLGNVKAQPIGPAVVDDLALPDEYLKRVSDRIIRTSFESRYRIVVPDPPAAAAAPTTSQGPAAAATGALAPAPKSGGSNWPLVIGTVALGVFVVVIVLFSRRDRAGVR